MTLAQALAYRLTQVVGIPGVCIWLAVSWGRAL